MKSWIHRGVGDRLGAVVLVAAATAAAWLLFSVSLGELLRYVAYEVAFTALPGTLAFMAFTGAPRAGLREVALGWALGYALELAAFAATAALGARGLFWVYPPLVVAAATAVLVLRPRRAARESTDAGLSPAQAWGLGLLIVVLLVYLAEGYFALNPLPGDVDGPVSYSQDYVWQISLAAEALHHWPATLPNVAGEDLRYHYFAYLHMAAASQVTDLELSLVNFRLWPVGIIVLVCLQLVAFARSLGATAWAGVGAGALAFLVGPFDPWPQPPSEFFTHIYLSASFGFGLVFFLPVAILVGERLRSSRLAGDWRAWVLVAVFASAASGAKAAILPVCCVALALLGVAALWTERGEPWGARQLLWRVAAAGAVLGALTAFWQIVLYTGTSGDLEIRPLNEVARLSSAAFIDTELGLTGLPKAIVVGLAAIPATLKLLAPLLFGLWGLAYTRGWRLPINELWVLALLAASVVTYYVFSHPGQSDVYLLYYGYVAATVLAAAGVGMLWRRYVHAPRLSAGWMAALAVGVLLVWITDGPPAKTRGEPSTPAVYRYWLGQVTWSEANSNLTPGLLAGMRWIADNTPGDAVLAVNNRWQDAAGFDARYCYWSAFAERRGLLECSLGTAHPYDFAPFSELQQVPSSGPFAGRAELNQTMFYSPSRMAARAAAREAAARFGVTHSVLDLVHPLGASAANVERLGRVVHRTDALVVVELPHPPG